MWFMVSKFQSMFSWLQGRNMMAEGHSGAKLLTSWCLRSKAQGKNASKPYRYPVKAPSKGASNRAPPLNAHSTMDNSGLMD